MIEIFFAFGGAFEPVMLLHEPCDVTLHLATLGYVGLGLKVLRAVDGPHRGGLFVLASRVLVGRCADADIQILASGVSRQHAKIVLEGDAAYLVDLSSLNGTWVFDRAIARHRLRPGDAIEIGGARYVYDELAHGIGSPRTSAVFREHRRARESLIRTKRLTRLPVPAFSSTPVGRDGSGPIPIRAPRGFIELVSTPSGFVEVPPDGSTKDPAGVRASRTKTSTGLDERPRHDDAVPYAPGYEPPDNYRPLPVPVKHRAGRRRAKIATMPGNPVDWIREIAAEEGIALPEPPTSSGPVPDGPSSEILTDILMYRHLRNRLLDGETLERGDDRLWHALRRRLRHPLAYRSERKRPPRRYQRFPCGLQAQLVSSPGKPDPIPIALTDISVGGARAISAFAKVDPGEEAWLRFESDDEPQTVRVRVIWTEPELNSFGFSFAEPA